MGPAMMGLGFGETVEHKRWSGEVVDAHGHRSSGWADPVPIEGVGVDILTSSEPRTPDGAEASRVDVRLYLPPGFTCGHRDLFIVRGQEYEVEGIGETLPNFFTGVVFRTEVNLRRHDG